MFLGVAVINCHFVIPTDADIFCLYFAGRGRPLMPGAGDTRQHIARRRVSQHPLKLHNVDITQTSFRILRRHASSLSASPSVDEPLHDVLLRPASANIFTTSPEVTTRGTPSAIGRLPPDERGTVSTCVALARRAPTVQSGRGRDLNGSKL
jgi:hypothetical protein